MTTQASAAYALDAGGSHTVVRTRRADGNERTWDEPSCAIATVGQRRAIKQLRRILGEVRAELADAGTMRGCIASSSCPVAGEAPPPELLVRAIAASGCTGGVVLVNDVVPLLWSDLLAGCGVIVNSGTGSAVIGRNSNGKLLKLGGHEHILGDRRRHSGAGWQSCDGHGSRWRGSRRRSGLEMRKGTPWPARSWRDSPRL